MQNTGVAKESVLSPTQFTLFINDLLIDEINENIMAFADDIVILCTSKQQLLDTIKMENGAKITLFK